jgi:hypothetical protein
MTDLATPARAIGGAHLISRDTNLRVHSFNSASGVTLTVVARMLGYDGQPVVCVFDQVPNTDRSIKSTIFALGEGWLVSVQAFASAGSPRRGQCFGRVELVEGLTGAVISLTPLLQGYIQDTTVRAWPGSTIDASTEGPGIIRSIAGTDPAAGVEISETVPTNARWRPLSVWFALTTSAVVANRTPRIVLDDGTTEYYRAGSGVQQTASGTLVYQASSAPISAGTGGGSNMFGLPFGLIMLGGHRIRTSTVALDVGDNYASPQLLVEEWIED